MNGFDAKNTGGFLTLSTLSPFKNLRSQRINTALVFIFFALLLQIASVKAQTISTHAPAFSLPSIADDHVISLNDYTGKIVYLDFWASWCGPCRASFPELQKMQDEFGSDNFTVIGINLDDDINHANRFLKRNPVSFTLLHDAEAITPRQYNVQAMPSSFIIDGAGNIRHSHAGFKLEDVDTIRQQIINLLKEVH